LTAGRGDGHYSLKCLGLKHNSYGNLDIFSSSYSSKNIVFKEDYDVFNPNTLDFVEKYDFIHVDVSFTKSSESNIDDLMMFFMTRKKEFFHTTKQCIMDYKCE